MKSDPDNCENDNYINWSKRCRKFLKWSEEDDIMDILSLMYSWNTMVKIPIGSLNV